MVPTRGVTVGIAGTLLAGVGLPLGCDGPENGGVDAFEVDAFEVDAGVVPDVLPDVLPRAGVGEG
jgi:hypothetical protein